MYYRPGHRAPLSLGATFCPVALQLKVLLWPKKHFGHRHYKNNQFMEVFFIFPWTKKKQCKICDIIRTWSVWIEWEIMGGASWGNFTAPIHWAAWQDANPEARELFFSIHFKIYGNTSATILMSSKCVRCRCSISLFSIADCKKYSN